jgi:hypothetical protein
MIDNIIDERRRVGEMPPRIILSGVHEMKEVREVVGGVKYHLASFGGVFRG